MRRTALRRVRAAVTLAVLTPATLAASAHAEPYMLVTAHDPGRVIRPFALPSSGLLDPLAGPYTSVGVMPSVAAVSPDGRSLYIGDTVPNEAPILQYDVAAGGAVTPKAEPDVATGSSYVTAIAPSPDGRRAFAVDLQNGRVAMLDVGANGGLENARAIAGTTSPVGVAVGADSRSVYVTDVGVIRQYDLAEDGTLTPKSPATVANAIFGLPLVSPDGRHLYVHGDGQIRRFDIGADGALTAAGGPDAAPRGTMAITPDGEHLFVYAGTGGTTTIHQFAIDGDGAVTPQSPATVSFSGTATGIAVAPDSASLYLTDPANDRIVQYTVRSDGTLAPKTPADVAAGTNPTTPAVTPQADLKATISSSPDPAAADEELTYTVTVSNEQGTPSDAATVATALPAGLTLVGASTPGGTCTTSGTITCEIAPIAQGRSTTVAVRARAVSAGTHNVTATVTGLAPDPDAADNTGSGAVTVVARAIAATAPASGIGAAGASLNGVVTPSAPGTTAWFEVGPTAAYGTTTTPVAIADGEPPTIVSATVAGLAAATTYHYRVVVTDSTGATIRGADRTFATDAAPAGPPPPERIETIRTVYVPVPATAGIVPGEDVDQTAPTVSKLALTPTRVRMRLSEAATVRVTIAVRRTRRGGKARRVARWVIVRRGTVRATEPGTAKLRVSKRLRTRRYRVTARATDAAGNAGRTVTKIRRLRKGRSTARSPV